MRAGQLKSILVPTDFSETGLLAVDHAAYMAKLFQAKLYILHVIETSEFLLGPYSSVMNIRDLEEIETVVTEKLDELEQRIRSEQGISVQKIVNSGRISSCIAETAKNIHADMIIMGTHGAKGFEEYFIGSNAHKTVTISPCPVITILTHAKRTGFQTIVVPIDDTAHSRQKVDHVIALATKYGAQVHLLGLLNEGDETDENKFNIKLDACEKAMKKAGLKPIRKLVRGKNIATEAMNYSEKVNADLVVIMTDHESDLNGIFMGALAKQIVNHSQVPVMSIRPVEGNYESVELSAATPF